MHPLLILVTVLACTSVIFGQNVREPAEKRLADSAAALQAFRAAAPEPARTLFDNALCIGVAPRRDPDQSAVDAKGFVSCRAKRGEAWSNPAALVIEGGGTFWMVVGAEIDVILLATNPSTASHFRDPEQVLGADPLTVPGPMRANQGPLRPADPVIFAYQQSATAMGGINIAGATVREDVATNAALYKQALNNSAILKKRGGPSLLSVDLFLAALRAFGPGQSDRVLAESQ